MSTSTVLIRAMPGGFSTMRPFSEKMSAGKGREWRGSEKEKMQGARRSWTPRPPKQPPPQLTRSKSVHPTLERFAADTDTLPDTLPSGLAPWAPFRATPFTTDIRMREAFADQDL